MFITLNGIKLFGFIPFFWTLFMAVYVLIFNSYDMFVFIDRYCNSKDRIFEFL